MCAYPFLPLQYFWQNYIYTKCQNINRNPGKGQDANEPRPKRARCSVEATKVHHPYPELSENMEDDISHERALQQINKELQNAKPNHEILKDLMTRTFRRRRSSILGDPKPVEEICLKYPLLQKPNYVNLLNLFLYGKQHNVYSCCHFNDYCVSIYRCHWNLTLF